MALRSVLQRNTELKEAWSLDLRRWAHAVARPAPFDNVISHRTVESPEYALPENGENNNNYVGNELPESSFVGGFMELMAVPKKKVSRHKRGIRNGPKALKPVPVIIRCKVCGRVKLPHFFCCSGIKENSSGQSGPNS